MSKTGKNKYNDAYKRTQVSKLKLPNQVKVSKLPDTQDMDDAVLFDEATLLYDDTILPLPINECIPYNDVIEKRYEVASIKHRTRSFVKIVKERGITTSCYAGQRILLIRYFLLRYNIYDPILENKIFKLINSSMRSGYGDYGGGPLKKQGRKSNNKFLIEKDVSDIIPALTWLCEISSNLFNFITNKCISLKNQEFSYFQNLFKRSQLVTIPIIIVIDDIVIHWFIIYRGKIWSTWGADTFYIKFSHTVITPLELFNLMTITEHFSVIMKATMLNLDNALNAYDKNGNLFNPQIQINYTLESYIDKNINFYELIGYQIPTIDEQGRLLLNPNITYIDTLRDVINRLSDAGLLDLPREMENDEDENEAEQSLIETIESTNVVEDARGFINKNKTKKHKRKTRKQRRKEDRERRRTRARRRSRK